MGDLFVLASDAFPQEAGVLTLRGREALSHPYWFDMQFAMTPEHADAIDPEAVVGQRAKLVVCKEDGEPRRTYHGIISELELETVTDGGTVARAKLVPKLMELKENHHSQVFVDKDLPEIIKAVFKQAGLESSDYELRLSGKYETLEFVCQYRESYFDFVSRWFEREGIYYYFEQGDEKEKLIITDNKDQLSSLPDAQLPIHFLATGKADTTGAEAVWHFRQQNVQLTKKFTLTDYSYLQPSMPLKGEADGPDNGTAAVVRHALEQFSESGVGKKLALVRAGEALARQTEYEAEGKVYDLSAGYLFELDRHPMGSINGEYLVTQLDHIGEMLAGRDDVASADGSEKINVYKVVAKALKSDVLFRPARKTVIPRIVGFETAIIDGEEDHDYAQLDDHGRYLLKFKFDESGLGPGKASARVRMLQPHAGNPENWHFPLRKGTEVLVMFLGGDPDRPMIAGAVPNPLTPSPVTSNNHTLNVLHTGGNNRLEIQDDAGKQYIDLSSPTENSFIHLGEHHGKTEFLGAHNHNSIASTDGNGLIHQGSDQDIMVDSNKTEDVQGDVTEKYNATQTTEVNGDVTEKYCATQYTKVATMCEEKYGTHETTVAAIKSEKCATQDTTVSGALQETHTIQMVNVGGVMDVTCASHTETAAVLVQKFAQLGAVISGGTTINSALGVTINAPSVTVMCTAGFNLVGVSYKSLDPAKKEETNAHKKETKGVSIALTGSANEAVAGKWENIGVNLGACGALTDIAGVQLALYGFLGEAATTKGKTHGIIISLKGVRITT